MGRDAVCAVKGYKNMKTTQHKNKLSESMQKRWQDPEYRKKIIEAQRKAGLR